MNKASLGGCEVEGLRRCANSMPRAEGSANLKLGAEPADFAQANAAAVGSRAGDARHAFVAVSNAAPITPAESPRRLRTIGVRSSSLKTQWATASRPAV
jgi:hypothetical protein